MTSLPATGLTLHLHIATLVLGAGERLFARVSLLDLVPTEVIASRDVTHVRCAVARGPAR